MCSERGEGGNQILKIEKREGKLETKWGWGKTKGVGWEIFRKHFEVEFKGREGQK